MFLDGPQKLVKWNDFVELEKSELDQRIIQSYVIEEGEEDVSYVPSQISDSSSDEQTYSLKDTPAIIEGEFL